MIRALRRSRLVTWVAVFALLSVVPATLVTSLHDDSDDALCNPAPVLHDHHAHRIGASDPAQPAPEHCFVCHWLQSLRGAHTSVGLVLPAAQAGVALRIDTAQPVTTPTTNRSGRAPPLA
jgi:hypothetical protein